MRRLTIVVLAVVLGCLSWSPPLAADEMEGFHGFTAFDTHAQGQVATFIGFLGNLPEEDRLVGALSEINGPPAGGRNIAAFFQKGAAASYTYGVFGGPGGAAGVLPQPGPGEAAAFFPAEPNEMTVEGPATRFQAKATETPTGRAEAAVAYLDVPGMLKVAKAVVVSHTEPVAGGVMAESTSTLTDVTIGPLQIQSLVSRAYGLITSVEGEPQGTAITVVTGATVAGTPVQITDQGVLVAGSPSPGGQDQVNAALAGAGFSDVRLLPSTVTAGEDGQTVDVLTGGLRVVHRDHAFGAQYLQGVEGGGFAVGGAQVSVLGRRCCGRATARP